MRAVNYNNATVQRTKVDTNSTNQFQIAAAVAGNRVVLLEMILVAAGAVTITLQSNNTALTGAMTMATGVPFQLNAAEYGAIQSATGEALNFTLGGGVQVSGVISWVYSDPTVDL